MSNEDGTIWITYNGETYNFKNLRKKLEKNHKFYSNTDTEVLIHAYEEYGIDFIKKLRVYKSASGAGLHFLWGALFAELWLEENYSKFIVNKVELE